MHKISKQRNSEIYFIGERFIQVGDEIRLVTSEGRNVYVVVEENLPSGKNLWLKNKSQDGSDFSVESAVEEGEAAFVN
ncbi:hypothetical protein FNU79_17560 [Deinococcus detaillensis]|uniref:Uncharacterized protein n=1 Tax=Deinococcus detaillensis TaxID=2592048 RepID=A0A553UHF7_9DEIO|nr:hypothetical protein [Deinococcus detaillensis]TSA79642.1 hypothetical protein FNU79_17560 [Deinococcus detaillensis]